MSHLIGHPSITAALERALSSASLPHAWLFSGPEGLGKRTAALEFAAALNCTSPSNRPCGDCRSCRDTFAGTHPDVEVIEPGGLCDESDHRDHADSRDLRICQVRRLQRVLSLAPYAGGRRVAVIDAADTLRAEAANAFLKTLEEPPAASVLILLVEREERLPETVLSRCRRLAFRPVDRETIREALLARGAEPSQAEAVAAGAGGRIGWAFRALEDPSMLDERSQILDDAVRLAHAGRVERFAWAKPAESRAGDVRERYLRQLAVWEDWWRDVLLVGAGASEGLINRDRAQQLAEEAKLYSTSATVEFLRALLKTREYLQENVDPQLALENLTLDLPRPTAGAGRSR